MNPLTPRRSRVLVLSLAFLAATAASPPSAWAMKNRTVVLRATGTGAVIGLAAGVVSYPFARSTGTLVAGAIVGALLGTVYGFYLVDRRAAEHPTALATPRDPTLDELYAANEARDATLRRGSSARAGIVLPFTLYSF